MARGPKPAPPGVVEQKAPVRSARRTSGIVPTPQGSPALAPPDWLKDDAAVVWERLAPTLAAARLLTAVDATTFARYCRNFARWLKMQLALDDLGETYEVETASGKVFRPRPEFLISDRLERQLISAEDRFGLNPAERQRIMAARAQTGVSGDLFAPANPVREEHPAADESPTRGSQSQGPIGLLN